MSSTISSKKRKRDDKPLSENLEKKFRAKLIEDFTQLIVSKGLTIFGRFVCEYMCGRSSDFDYDIDIFSYTCDLKELKILLRKNGFRVTAFPPIDESNIDVYKMFVGFQNDILFTGSNIEISVNFFWVLIDPDENDDKKLSPPFGRLNFECDALIWDKHGIRLSRNTGTDIDSLSARDLKLRERKILDDANAKIATYIPLEILKDAPTGMEEGAIRFRKMRAKHIVKSIEHGWTVKPFDHFIEVQADSGDSCMICQGEFTGKYIKMSCSCGSKYHHECFVQFTQSSLNDKTFIRCAQRCNDVYL